MCRKDWTAADTLLESPDSDGQRHVARETRREEMALRMYPGFGSDKRSERRVRGRIDWNQENFWSQGKTDIISGTFSGGWGWGGSMRIWALPLVQTLERLISSHSAADSAKPANPSSRSYKQHRGNCSSVHVFKQARRDIWLIKDVSRRWNEKGRPISWVIFNMASHRNAT